MMTAQTQTSKFLQVLLVDTASEDVLLILVMAITMAAPGHCAVVSIAGMVGGHSGVVLQPLLFTIRLEAKSVTSVVVGGVRHPRQLDHFITGQNLRIFVDLRESHLHCSADREQLRREGGYF